MVALDYASQFDNVVCRVELLTHLALTKLTFLRPGAFKLAPKRDSFFLVSKFFPDRHGISLPTLFWTRLSDSVF